MTITDNEFDISKISIADIAVTFPHAVEILSKYNLDYCCGGKKPFVKVCEKAGLNPELIWSEIESSRANRGMDNRMQFDLWDTSLLINFIEQHHHSYVRQSIPKIKELLNKVCSAHGEDSPFLIMVRDDFNEVAEELLNHMPKEEQVLFPALRELQNGATAPNLSAPISVMEHDHERAGALIKSIRTLTNNYTPPSYACPTFKVTYIMLDQFDKDLMQHIHLENNILFPKAIGK